MFENITFYCVNINTDEDYEKMMTLSYIDEIRKNIKSLDKENVIGYLITIDAESFSLGFIPSKAREAINKGLTVVIKKGAGT